MGTKAYQRTYACMAAMQSGTQSFAEFLGASPVMKLYNGTPPTKASDALSGNTLLATLPCSATPISGSTDVAGAARQTWNAITSATAAASGTCTFGRTYKSDGTTPVDQYNVDTTGADLNLSTNVLSAGSTVSVSSRLEDAPYM